MSHVSVLHVDIGPGVNRSVITLAGTAAELYKGILALYESALALIDMNVQKGAHPRVGAVDVCPIIPLQGTSMEDATQLARRIGNGVFERFKLPVFFYEEASYLSHHKALPTVRKGEYEGLSTRLDLPDLWSGRYHPTAGATVIGARKVLIAYNLTLDNDASVEDAHWISRRLRSVRTIDPVTGESVGALLPKVRAIGWKVDGSNEIQVSCNLLDYTVTPMKRVFDVAQSLASRRQCCITSSELIGLAPINGVTGSMLDDAYSINAAQQYLLLSTQLEERLLERLL